ncbi:MAG: hypothetical protein Q9212_000385 [Teloschistes hypoglaucus]
MSSQINEIADIPRDFLREGTQFMNRCAKPDKREFIKISQAVGIGFVVMGAIGYVVKLSKWTKSPELGIPIRFDDPAGSPVPEPSELTPGHNLWSFLISLHK